MSRMIYFIAANGYCYSILITSTATSTNNRRRQCHDITLQHYSALRRPNLGSAMGFQATETVSQKDGNPFFLLDQDIGDITDRAPGSQLLEGSRGTSILVARAVAACVFCFFIGAMVDQAVCAESKTGAQLAAPTKKERAQPNAVVETNDEKQGLERRREK